MRPTSTRQSALRYPLNYILGTEAAVRVLRVVHLSDIPINVSELARQAQLQKSGVARICTRLEDLGVLDAIGRGERNRQYRRSARFPLGPQLAMLFNAEKERANRLISDVAGACGGLPYVLSAWIEGPVAAGADRPGDPMRVGVLVDANSIEPARATLWSGMMHLQDSHDLTIELKVWTMADLQTLPTLKRKELERVVLLRGPAPLDLIPGGPRRGERQVVRHQALDARSSDTAGQVAELLKRDPTLLERARDYLDRRIPGAAPGERLELEEWRGLLKTISLPRLRRFLVSDDPRSVRLRQSSPFLAVLTDAERQRLRERLTK